MTIDQINPILSEITEWAARLPDIHALAWVGSYARNAAKETSDIDLVLISTNPNRYLQETNWGERFGTIREQQIEDDGLLISIRAFYIDGREVEYGIGDERWSAIPLEAGTRRVISDGMRVLFERGNILSRHQ